MHSAPRNLHLLHVSFQPQHMPTMVDEAGHEEEAPTCRHGHGRLLHYTPRPSSLLQGHARCQCGGRPKLMCSTHGPEPCTADCAMGGTTRRTLRAHAIWLTYTLSPNQGGFKTHMAPVTSLHMQHQSNRSIRFEIDQDSLSSRVHRDCKKQPWSSSLSSLI